MFQKSILFFAGLSIFWSSCTKETDPNPYQNEPINSHTIVIGNGDGNPTYLGTNYTFKNNPYTVVDYIIKDWIIIYDSTTTIEPGCVIYFEGTHSGMITQGNGALYAQGSAENPIIFSSTEKWAGSWKGIFIGTPRYENVFSYCTFEYAGNSPIEQISKATALGVHQDNNQQMSPIIHVNNCTFNKNNGFGFYCEPLNARILDFSANSFKNQQGVPLGMPFKLASSIQSNNSFLNTQFPNSYRYILLFNDGFNQNSDLEENLTLKKLDVSYRLQGNEGPTIISAGLEIEAGVSMEFDIDGGLLIKDGYLKAIGNSNEPIIFKGINGTHGKWIGISFQTDNANNILSYCDIANAGSKKSAWCDGQAAVSLGNWFGISGKAEINNCKISNSGAYAIAKKNSSTLIQANNTFSLNTSSPDIYNYQ